MSIMELLLLKDVIKGLSEEEAIRKIAVQVGVSIRDAEKIYISIQKLNIVL